LEGSVGAIVQSTGVVVQKFPSLVAAGSRAHASLVRSPPDVASEG
jgi:hypothetical protein